MKKRTVEELVINLDPKSKPYSIYTLVHKLSLSSKCFVQFFVHGSIQTLLKTDKALEKKLTATKNFFDKMELGLKDPRSTYDFCITFIWKKGK